MFRSETQYALRVLTELARREGKTAAAELAESTLVPAPMLGKVLHRLSLAGFVRGRPGPGGGYELARPARRIPLREVIDAVEGPAFGRACLFGLPTCSDDDPCPLHGFWGPMRDGLNQMLARHSLADLADNKVRPARGR